MWNFSFVLRSELFWQDLYFPTKRLEVSSVAFKVLLECLKKVLYVAVVYTLLSPMLIVLCLCPVWMQQTYVHAVVVDPEVVFVANQTCAQAPSLVASFQCDCHLKSDGSLLSLSSNIRDLQLLACPFIHKQEDKAVSTVRPDKHSTWHYCEQILKLSPCCPCCR